MLAPLLVLCPAASLALVMEVQRRARAAYSVSSAARPWPCLSLHQQHPEPARIEC